MFLKLQYQIFTIDNARCSIDNGFNSLRAYLTENTDLIIKKNNGDGS
jgi:hypothetical protein